MGVRRDDRLATGLYDLDVVERVVNHVLGRGVEVRFHGLERRPPADGHNHTRIHRLVDEEKLGEPSSEVVDRHVEIILLVGSVGGGLGGRFTVTRTPPGVMPTYAPN